MKTVDFFAKEYGWTKQDMQQLTFDETRRLTNIINRRNRKQKSQIEKMRNG